MCVRVHSDSSESDSDEDSDDDSSGSIEYARYMRSPETAS